MGVIPSEADKYRPYFDEGWLEKLWPFLLSKEYDAIKETLRNELKAGVQITPNVNEMFNAFKYCKYKDLRVVLVGQDPYPELGVAHGLAFSSKKDKLPKSLQVIYEGMEDDLYQNEKLHMKRSHDLTYLAEQGVLLLNMALTTHVGKSRVHLDLWKPFIKFLVQKVFNEINSGIIFGMWGREAKEIDNYLVPFTHWYVYADHPASVAYAPPGTKWAHKKCFSEINRILEKSNGKDAMIKWDESEVQKEEFAGI